MQATMASSVSSYYQRWETRIGNRLMLGRTRHTGFYDAGTLYPFPLSSSLRRMEHQLYQALDLTNKAKVLDAGSGNGDVAIYMERKGLSVQGVELLPQHVLQAQENFKRNNVQANVQQGNYEHLRFKSDSFDGAYTMETLVHASDPDKAIRELYRVLKPGGVVVLSEYEHDIDETKPFALAALTTVNTYAHMPAFQQFKIGTIEKKLEQAGFQDIEVRDYSVNVLPMVRLCFIIALLPYILFRLLGLETYVINAMAAVVAYRYGDDFRYLMIRARKPWATDQRPDVKNCGSQKHHVRPAFSSQD